MIVTISRDYGAAGLAVATAVATALGFELLNDELQKRVAARLGTSADEVAARASADESFSERVLSGLGAGTAEVASPSVPTLPGEFDEALRQEIERTIRERAELGSVVILGRNAGGVLGRRADVLRVFLTGERAWRVARIVDSFGVSRAEAEADIERIDSARRKVARDRYKLHWADAHAYDVTLDVSRVGIEGAAELIVLAVRALEVGA